MPRRIAISNLNASTIDILNTIRANAGSEYQDLVPKVTSETDIPKVGEVLYGYPAMANKFLECLVNRIALVKVKSATFNNAYAMLKKGYLEFGETVEEVFVNITKAREFSAEKAEYRELKRSMPDVRSAFHTMNWRVQYPVTIQDMDLRQAFLSMDGVQDLIARIVDAVYTAAEYDEFLLFKYLLIKAVANGKVYPVAFDGTDFDNSAIAFRAISNGLTFMKKQYNEAGVTTTTPRGDQFIFMDATFNARFDVKILADAFNMDKTDFIGRLLLIDDFTTFDNERFDVIRSGSDMIEAVTPQELALMGQVRAILVDKEWFQVYDNQARFTEKYVASGGYWNYFYNVWKTVSYSPFSNAVVFVEQPGPITALATIQVSVSAKEIADTGTIFTLKVNPLAGFSPSSLLFKQTETATQAGVAVKPYGAVIFPTGVTSYGIVAETPSGESKYAGATLELTAEVGDVFNLNLQP